MTILYFLGAILILGLVVVCHEWGHFFSARLLGVPVEEFAVGMGPKLISRTHNGTVFSLRAVPFGGFCKYVGEDEDGGDNPDAMSNQKWWKRFIMVFSGPFMNFVLAFVVTIIYFSIIGVPGSVPLIDSVIPDMPAKSAGLIAGDIVTRIGDQPIEYSSVGAANMQQIVGGTDPGTTLDVTVKRGDVEHTVVLVPSEHPDSPGAPMIGVVFGQARIRYDVITSGRVSWRVITSFVSTMGNFLKNLIFKGEGLDQTAGPLGMIDMMTKEISGGIDDIINLIVMLSLNLGIMNLLPLPALDGGRLVFILVEAVIRRPIKPEFEGMIHAAGFLLLIGFMVFISYKDIVRLITQ